MALQKWSKIKNHFIFACAFVISSETLQKLVAIHCQCEPFARCALRK